MEKTIVRNYVIKTEFVPSKRRYELTINKKERLFCDTLVEVSFDEKTAKKRHKEWCKFAKLSPRNNAKNELLMFALNSKCRISFRG